MSLAKQGARRAAKLEKLGRYELIAQIGVGGMAEVHLARQRGPGGFEKIVVVKKIHPHLSKQQEFIDMLLDEARIAALLKHPRVIDIYDLGVARNTYFIAMEYLDGQPLNKIITHGRKSDPLDVFSSARIIADAADGLHAAHHLKTMRGDSLELVHRDVSPGNIIVLYDGNVKLVDFGVAKARGRIASTDDGRMKGKLGYVPPETIKDEPVDARSDVYSLGVVMWELLALRRLYWGGSEASRMQAILKGAPDAPSKFRKEVPVELDAICMRALARDPKDRFESAHQMQVMLEDFLREANYYREAKGIARYMNTSFSKEKREQQALLRKVASATETLAVPTFDADEIGDFGEESSVQTLVRDPSVSTANEHTILGTDAPDRPAFPLPAPRSDSVPVPVAKSAPPSTRVRGRPTSKIGPLAEQETQTGVDTQVKTDVKDIPPGGESETETDIEIDVVEADNTAEDDDTSTAVEAAVEAAAPEPGHDTETDSYKPPPVPPVEVDTPAHTQTVVVPPLGRPRASGRGWIAAVIVVVLGGGVAAFLGLRGGDDEKQTSPTPAVATNEHKPAPEPEPEPVVEPEAEPEPEPEAAPDPAVADILEADPEPEPEPEPIAKPKHKPRPKPAPKPKADPAAAKAAYKDGFRLYIGGKLGPARTKFKEALDLDPKYADPHRGLGLVYEKQGSKSKAVRAFKKYLRMKPRAKDAANIEKRIANLGG